MPRWILAIIVGVLGFAVGRATLSAGLDGREPMIPIVDPIRASYAASSNAINTLLLGSSRVYRGLDPAVFDETLAQADVTSRTFNHSWPDMSLVEMLRVLESLPADAALERVVIEPSLFSLWVVENPSSVRARAFHTPQTTLDMLRLIGCGNYPVGDAIEAGYHTLMAGLSHGVGVGTVRDGLWETDPLPEASNNGFRPLDLETDDGFLERHRKLKRRAKAYKKRVSRISQKQKLPRELAVCERELIERVVAVAESRGAQVTILIPPTVRRVREYAGLRAGLADLGVSVLAYDNPTLYPDLYAIKHRFDVEHLNAKGARLWAQMVARDLLALEREG